MKIYLGCSLTYANEEYRKNIEKLKDKLREKYIVFDFLGLVNGSVEEVYKCDTNCLKACDVMIAECSYPSTGLGYELGLGIEKGKKIYAFAQKKSRVSRVILGINNPNFKFDKYEDFDELYKKIKVTLEEFENKL